MAALLLLVALLVDLKRSGPPYFAGPMTIADRLGARPREARDALLLMERARQLIPAGSEVTCFMPRAGRSWEHTSAYLTAVGMLPEHVVLPPFRADDDVPRADLIEYVIALKEPFTHAGYAIVRRFPEGAIYRAVR